MRRPQLLLAAAALVIAAGCGFSTDRDVREVASEDLFGLDQTTTTTSTTTTSTTLAPTVVSPPPDQDSTTTSSTITPTTAIITQPVELFFLDGTEITSVSQNLAGDVPSLTRVLSALQSGPPSDDTGIGLQTAVPRNIVDVVTSAGGVATVDLVGEVYDRIDSEDELPAIAQIVLTLTSQSGIGQVRFTLDGEPLPVRLGNNRVPPAGEPVSFDDYAVLLAGDSVGDSPPTGTVPETTEPTTDTESGTSPPPTSGG